jgi:ketosteroid isomerase-like protein
MATEQQPTTKSTGTASTRSGIGPAVSSDLIRLAVAHNDALDRCTRTGGANIDELMDLFAEDAVWVLAGGGRRAARYAESVELVGGETLVGKAAIRAGFLRRAGRYQQVVEIEGIDVWGDLVICRLERRDTTYAQPGVERQVRILLVKGGKITQVTVVFDPEAFERMRTGATP